MNKLLQGSLGNGVFFCEARWQVYKFVTVSFHCLRGHGYNNVGSSKEAGGHFFFMGGIAIPSLYAQNLRVYQEAIPFSDTRK